MGTKIYCDICEMEIDRPSDIPADETNMVLMRTIFVEVWKQGVFFPEHICLGCKESILDHIKKISGKEFLMKGWIKK